MLCKISQNAPRVKGHQVGKVLSNIATFCRRFGLPHPVWFVFWKGNGTNVCFSLRATYEAISSAPRQWPGGMEAIAPVTSMKYQACYEWIGVESLGQLAAMSIKKPLIYSCVSIETRYIRRDWLGRLLSIVRWRTLASNLSNALVHSNTTSLVDPALILPQKHPLMIKTKQREIKCVNPFI